MKFTKTVITFWNNLHKQPIAIQKEATLLQSRIYRSIKKYGSVEVSAHLLEGSSIALLATKRAFYNKFWKAYGKKCPTHTRLSKLSNTITEKTLSFTLPASAFTEAFINSNNGAIHKTLVLAKAIKILNYVGITTTSTLAVTLTPKRKKEKLVTFTEDTYIKLFGWSTDLWSEAVLQVLKSGDTLPSPMYLQQIKSANPYITKTELLKSAQEASLKSLVPDFMWENKSKENLYITTQTDLHKLANLLAHTYSFSQKTIKGYLSLNNPIQWDNLLKTLTNRYAEKPVKFYLWEIEAFEPHLRAQVKTVSEAHALLGVTVGRLNKFLLNPNETQLNGHSWILTKTSELPFNPNDYAKNMELFYATGKVQQEIISPQLRNTLSAPALYGLELFNRGWVKAAGNKYKKLSKTYTDAAISERVPELTD